MSISTSEQLSQEDRAESMLVMVLWLWEFLSKRGFSAHLKVSELVVFGCTPGGWEGRLPLFASSIALRNWKINKYQWHSEVYNKNQYSSDNLE